MRTALCLIPLVVVFGCAEENPPPYEACTSAEGGAYSISGIEQNGAEFTITASYSGGCETHDFRFCWPSQAYVESNPPQVDLELFHEDGGDTCEAAVTEEFTLSVVPLIQHRTYGNEPTGSLVVNLEGESFRVDY